MNSFAPAALEILEDPADVSTEDLILMLGMLRYERSQTPSTTPLHPELRRLADNVYSIIRDRAPKGVAVKAHFAARRFAKWQKTSEDEFREEASQIAALFTE